MPFRDVWNIPTRPDPDHRASVRVLLAARMLCEGADPGRVSAATRVPFALVDLLRDEISRTGGERGEGGAS